VRSNRSAKKTKFLSYLRKTAQGLAQTLYCNRKIAALARVGSVTSLEEAAFHHNGSSRVSRLL